MNCIPCHWSCSKKSTSNNKPCHHIEYQKLWALPWCSVTFQTITAMVEFSFTRRHSIEHCAILVQVWLLTQKLACLPWLHGIDWMLQFPKISKKRLGLRKQMHIYLTTLRGSRKSHCSFGTCVVIVGQRIQANMPTYYSSGSDAAGKTASYSSECVLLIY